MKSIVTRVVVCILAVLLTGSFIGCKKKDNDPGQELFIGVTWEPSADADPNPSANPPESERYNWPDCALGASVKFTEAGKLELSLGTNPCDPAVFEALSIIQTTGFSYNPETKELKTALGTITVDVLHLSDTHLKLGTAVPPFSAQSTYTIFLFEKK